MKRPSKRKLGKELLVIFLLSSIMAFLMCVNCFQSWERLLTYFGINYTIWLVMWYGNTYVSIYIDNVYSWLKDPVKRFLLGIIGAAAYSAMAMLTIIWFYKIVMDIDITDNNPKTIYITVILAILVLTVLLAIEFLHSWRALALQEEKMKNEVLTSKFQLLKSQVNPHFMFNSLNTLTSLIHQNQDLAAKYVGQLSKVYRSVLSSAKNEIVTIEEELKILESYIFLQSIRFEDRLIVNINLSDSIKEKYIPPMALQILIENCIKHNEITKENPLNIEVFCEDEMICVKNKTIPKQILPGDNSSIGLSNIVARYEILSDIPVEVLDDGKEFIVKLPILILE